MQAKIDKINQEQQRKLEECIENLQQGEEQDDNFAKQIQQEVSTLSNSNIQNEVQQNQQQFQNQKKETQPKQELKIQDSDCLIQQLSQSNHKPFTYQLMEENSIKQDIFCKAIAVNQDSSIMVAGCENEITVFEFNQGILKQIQILSEHTESVSTLIFMKRSDQFISGSQDGTIRVWGRIQNKQWVCLEKLKEQGNVIFCLALNNNEDLIASAGSGDKAINLWQKENEWFRSQIITGHTQSVYGLIFNEQQNRLISSGSDGLIQILELSEQDKQWIVIQQINVEVEGVRLCFIDNNTFTLYPWGKDYIDIFEMNISNQQYSQTKVIPVKGGEDWSKFPQQYIQSKCILVNKNGSNVSIIRKQQNGEFINELSIEFGTFYIFGCMTEDGQYLITWDDKSLEFQIRKFQEQ